MDVEVEWVVFDAVGTVIDPEPGVAEAYHLIGRQFGSERTLEDVRSRFKTAFADTESLDRSPETAGMVTSSAIEEARWRYIVAAVFPEVDDSEGCFQRLHDYFAEPTAWRAFDDTLPTLHSLSERGIRLAIASNFDQRLHPICDGIAALGLFEKRFISSELGFRKPSADFYHTVVSEVNVASEQILMVGDGLENDVEGALSVGMHAVLIDRNLARDQSGGHSELRYSVIRSLNDLQGLLT
ncbi:MAG: putative hydrolase of the HAD superfamily [Planctomycetaceae bacterium]